MASAGPPEGDKEDKPMNEADQLKAYMVRGTTMLVYFPRREPERRTISVALETYQLIVRFTTEDDQEGECERTIDMMDVKEVRSGKSSRNFERWSEEAKLFENSKCFTICFGAQFRLHSLSFAAQTDDQCESWVTGLRSLVDEAIYASFPFQIEKWLRKEFNIIKNAQEKITLKEVEEFLPRFYCKLSTSEVHEIFEDVDTNKRGELGFGDFFVLYHRLKFSEIAPEDSAMDNSPPERPVLDLNALPQPIPDFFAVPLDGPEFFGADFNAHDFHGHDFHGPDFHNLEYLGVIELPILEPVPEEHGPEVPPRVRALFVMDDDAPNMPPRMYLNLEQNRARPEPDLEDPAPEPSAPEEEDLDPSDEETPVYCTCCNCNLR